MRLDYLTLARTNPQALRRLARWLGVKFHKNDPHWVVVDLVEKRLTQLAKMRRR